MSSQQNKDEEQKFTIQPHPQDNHSNTNAPFQPANATQAALSGTPGPVVIDSATASKLEAPKSKEELAQLSAKLNKND
jgi:hypothetical protein